MVTEVCGAHFGCDGNVNSNSSNAYFPNVGGNYNDEGNAGLFYCNVNYNSTNSNSNIGSRLAIIDLTLILSVTTAEMRASVTVPLGKIRPVSHPIGTARRAEGRWVL